MSQPLTKPEVGLSLDGLLATQNAGRNGPLGEPRPGASAFTRRLAKKWRVVIFTHRVHWDMDEDRPTEPQLERACRPIIDWCNKNNIWFDGVFIGQGKPDLDMIVGPRVYETPLNPTPDDFCEIESELAKRIK